MRRLTGLLIAGVALVAPASALAHPLGNFTVNRASALVLSGDRVYVHYVVDLAEIPSFQLGARVRAPGFGRSVAGRLDLRLDGRRVDLRLLDSAVTAREGAGGLETLRFEAVYKAIGRGRRLTYRDQNFGSRRGWQEVVVRAERGARLVSSSVPRTSPSRALTAYPTELLQEPSQVTGARASFLPGDELGAPPRLDGSAPREPASDGFEGLVARDLTAGLVVFSLLAALFWGAAHALTPGHGKAIVAAYLVGTRGTARHAALLGLIVTVTHTVGVFALGLVTLALSQLIVPEQLYPWLNLASALLVVAVGVAVLRARVRGRARHDHHHGHHHDHAHHGERGHHHHHDADRGDHHHHHHHLPASGSGLRGLLAVGVSGGLLPCPSALVVLLAAISLERIGYGLVLIVAFSLGLASVITGIGLVAVAARRTFARLRLDGPVVRVLPAVSAFVIVALGVAMTVRALPPLL
jgi:nickel/cobalt transporter (NicO) family protein